MAYFRNSWRSSNAPKNESTSLLVSLLTLSKARSSIVAGVPPPSVLLICDLNGFKKLFGELIGDASFGEILKN